MFIFNKDEIFNNYIYIFKQLNIEIALNLKLIKMECIS
jgi:hypothetical protein